MNQAFHGEFGRHLILASIEFVHLGNKHNFKHYLNQKAINEPSQAEAYHFCV